MAPRRIGIRHIEAFRIVMVTGSMTEAARHIHTSQPQVSRLIAQLEAIVGFALFDRNGSRLAPTYEAVLFSREVETTFSGLTALEIAAARICSFGSSQLAVAAMPRLAGGVLARAVARFKQKHPNVLVSIHSGDAGTVQSWVGSGVCDVGLAMVPDEPAGTMVRRLSTMNCVAVLPKGHPLAALARLRAQDLHGQDFVAFPSGSPLRKRLDETFALDKVFPSIVAEANLGASVCALVGAGLGISVVNPLAARDDGNSSGLVTRPFTPKIPIGIVLLYPASGPHTRLVEAFSNCAAAMIEEEFGGL